MYSGASASAGALSEEFLLGKRRFDQPPSRGSSTADELSKTIPARSAAAPSLVNTREMEMRLREDPLFTIKKKEKEMADEIMRNPLRRAQYEARLAGTSQDPHRGPEQLGSARGRHQKDEGSPAHGHHYRRSDSRHQDRRNRSRSPRRERSTADRTSSREIK